MATVGHLPFVISNSSSLYQAEGRSLFQSSVGSCPSNGFSYRNMSENLAVSSNENELHDLSDFSKSGQSIVRHLQEAVNLCNVYLKELSNVCSLGIKTAKFLTSSIQEISQLTALKQSCCAENHSISQRIADSYANAWVQLSLMLKNIGGIIKGGILSAVQEVISDLEEKSLSYSLPLFASESNKVLMTSLLTMSHLQYEFSFYMCEALFDLVNLNPECFNISSELVQKSSKNDSKLSEYLMLCLNSLATLRKQFSETVHGCKMKSPFHECTNNERDINESRPVNTPEVKKFECGSSKDKFLSDNNWSIASEELLTDNFSKKFKQQDSSPTVHLSFSPTKSLLNTSKEKLWPLDTVPEGNWVDIQNSDMDRISYKEKNHKSVFASHEELQDVIGLLSCQTSNSSSPVSEDSIASHWPEPNYDCNTSFLWPLTTADCSDVTSHATEKENKELANDSKIWLHENGLLPIWNTSLMQKATLSDMKPIFSPLTTEISFNHFNGQPLDSCNTLPYLNSNAQEFSSKNCLPLQNSKNSSWPVNFHTQSSNDGLIHSKSSGDDDEEPANNFSEKEKSFFLGIDFVGKDLMASVRQRRHSSGGPFPENFLCSKSTSARTKSIDSIVMEERSLKEILSEPTKSRNSTSPLSSSLEKLTAASMEDMFCHFDNLPQGLPPSGLEGRQKHKPERKYSLFGQGT